MLLIIKFLSNIIKILNSEISPKQIAAGCAFGALIGFIPVRGLLPYVFLILSFIVNVNLSALGVTAAIFKLISFVIDPIANQLGYYFLTKVPALKPFWTKLYNTPIIPYTNFNNTIVLGSLIIGILLLIPVYFLAKAGVHAFRTRWKEKFQRLRIIQVITASSFYKYYETLRGFRGE